MTSADRRSVCLPSPGAPVPSDQHSSDLLYTDHDRIFGVLLYLIGSTASFLFVFDKTQMKHPKFLRNQIRQEIRQALAALPVMAALTTPIFVAEVRGYTRLYDSAGGDESPGSRWWWWYTYLQCPLFIAFTDLCIYWIHRGLHHPRVYRHLHKPHHRWIVPTPYASYAFHPLDGFSQSLPYHIYPALFPLHKLAYVALYGFVTVWTVLIRKSAPSLDPVRAGVP